MNTTRIKELINQTDVWVVVQDLDGQNYIQDITGHIITGPLASVDAELITRLRNYFPILLQEVEQSRTNKTMMP